MSKRVFKYSAVIASLLTTAVFTGCGTSHKEGNLTVGDVAKVDESLCAQCHGSAREKLTGRVIYDDYSQSVHALNQIGCQDCHGGGAQHNGVGPIPYPKPGPDQCKVCHDSAADPVVTKYLGSKHFSVAIENEENEPCQRCHTHEGAVLAAQFHFTGDGPTMDALVNAPGVIPEPSPIKCNTCHVTHKPNELRIDSAWQPSTVKGAAVAGGSDQYRLCTQCHTYINPAGALAGSGSATSGTVRVGHHETSWYRVIASTHYDDPTTEEIEGYGVRTTNENSCFDCHGHESKTNSSTSTASPTIYTDWAQSGHAGGILVAKLAAATANPVNTTLPRTDPVRVAQGIAQVDAVMAAVADIPIENGQSCARCHTSSGLVQFLANPALGGSYTINATTGVATTVSSTIVAPPTGELVMCWGCHSDAGNGVVRPLATANGTATTKYTATSKGHVPTAYQIDAGKNNWFIDVGKSNICITCHDGRNSDPAAVTAAMTANAATASTLGSHHASAAATMYVKQGFYNLSTGTAYVKSLKADLDGGTVTSTHRKLGTPAINGDSHNPTKFVAGFLDSEGPCVTCHLTGSHSLAMDQKTIDAVCSNCHTSEAGHSIATAADFATYFLEPQSEVFQDALALAAAVFNSNQSTIVLAKNRSGEYSAYKKNGTVPFNDANYAAYLAGGTAPSSAAAADWTTVAGSAPYTNKTKLLGAVSNVLFLSKDKAAYAHARTYTRRLLYDSIDFLDDGSLNGTVGATAVAISPTVYGKGATAYTDGTLTTLATGTTEAMVYLIGWSRSTGAWNSTARP
ncbi:cytochrome c3 family protein [Geomonas agri]|uniref:cytochrome c3 family protein n=1 Tax=Geomonas agri TaxID=2873702 RepID=UPI001CD4FD56|nr:cytochrome c3 family protein [Geomonas agri]